MKPDPRPCQYVYWGWASSAVIKVLAIVPKSVFLLFFKQNKQNPLPVTQCILEYLIPERGLNYIIFSLEIFREVAVRLENDACQIS